MVMQRSAAMLCLAYFLSISVAGAHHDGTTQVIASQGLARHALASPDARAQDTLPGVAAPSLSAPADYDCGDFVITVLSSPELVVMTSGKRMFRMAAIGGATGDRYADTQGNTIWRVGTAELRLKLVWETEARTCRPARDALNLNNEVRSRNS